MEPTFESVAPLVAPIDASLFALLLTAAAQAARENRALFLVDDPDHLGPLVAALTFAFPETLRAELTFSTYHDRPEELAGFRIQGTVPAARPNRMVLGRLGIILDRTTGTCEPPLEPAPWRQTLSGWFHQHDSAAAAAWNETNRRASKTKPPKPPEQVWDDAWLNHLVEFHAGTRPGVRPPDEPSGWKSQTDLTVWSAQTGLGEEWTTARDPSWWRAAAAEHASRAEAREALKTHLRVTSSWRDADRTLSALRGGLGRGHRRVLRRPARRRT